MSIFRFKQFSITQKTNAMKVGTDAMLLGSHVLGDAVSRVLDIGAGTGVISLMLAQRFPNCTITAVELDENSSHECRLNFEASNWSERLQVIRANFLDFTSDEQFDLIVSNPPYYQTQNENKDVRMATAKHASNLPMHLLLAGVTSHLTNNGKLWLILPAEDRDKWVGEARNQGLFLLREIAIIGKQGDKVKRSILVMGRKETTLIQSNFTVRNSDGSYSEEYIQLTADYHLSDLRRNTNK